MGHEQLVKLLKELVKQPKESEWVEFKQNFHSPEEIGERISALANGACLHNQQYGYLVFGVEDATHVISGTSFKAKSHKKGKEELESWLINRLDPRIDFRAYEFEFSKGINISMYIIPAADNRPISFLHEAYIRIGSYTRKLGDFPEKQGKIWRKQPLKPLQEQFAKEALDASEVISLLNTQVYYDLLGIPYPSTREGVIDKFIMEGFITEYKGNYNITKLGALTLAKNLDDFGEIGRKAVRVIVYKGKNKVQTERESR